MTENMRDLHIRIYMFYMNHFKPKKVYMVTVYWNDPDCFLSGGDDKLTRTQHCETQGASHIYPTMGHHLIYSSSINQVSHIELHQKPSIT